MVPRPQQQHMQQQSQILIGRGVPHPFIGQMGGVGGAPTSVTTDARMILANNRLLRPSGGVNPFQMNYQ